MGPSANEAGVVILPGFVNAHAHAFQRLLRGRVQRGSPAASHGARRDSFWTWREAMYALADTLDVAGMEQAARLVFTECLEAGYTAIGEFHYLHRPEGADEVGLLAAAAMLRAARQTGIRLSLLLTAYRCGGFGQTLNPRQRRFDAGPPDRFARFIDIVSKELRPSDDGRIRLGVAIHSVRAVAPDDLGIFAALARSRGLPLHVHASEQVAEVEACLRATGRRPIALLEDSGVLGPDCAVIHATHCDDDDLDRLARTGTTVVICPTTEGDLGDGVPRTAAMYARGIPLAIGSDSHAVIDPLAELRRLEHDARAACQQRCILVDDAGDPVPPLLAIGSHHGFRSIGFDGAPDDWVALSADHRFFTAVDAVDRPAAALLGGHQGLVDRVVVGGECLVSGGRHLFVP